MENSMAVLPEKRNRTTIWPRNPISGYICKRIKNKYSDMYMHKHVSSSIIRNSQKVEIAKMSLSVWMDKHPV